MGAMDQDFDIVVITGAGKALLGRRRQPAQRAACGRAILKATQQRHVSFRVQAQRSLIYWDTDTVA